MKFLFSKKLIFTYLISLSVIGFLVSLFLWSREPKTLQSELPKEEKISQEVLKSFSSLPAMKIEKQSGFYLMADDTADEIEIKFANEKEDEEANKLKEENRMKINFPESYSKPIEIKLEAMRTILMTDNQNSSQNNFMELPSGQDGNAEDSPKESSFSSDLLILENAEKENGDKNLEPEENPELEESYIQYRNNRKKIIYAYQKDQATGEKKLKNWVLYEKGSGTETESYTFENAKVKINGKGEAEVFYYGQREIQNEQVMGEVEPNLLERAQKFLQKEAGENILNGNQKPDFTIPKPYYLAKGGEKKDLEWKLDEKTNTISLEIKLENENSYPIAVDPTLIFRAPGQSNSGSYIIGENSDDYFGWSMTSGDFNADGKVDLAVGAQYYSSGVGRVYIFYNDGSTPTTAATADVIITGEASSYFGSFVTSGDFNADGKVDLAVGAYRYSTSTGRAYIFYNDGAYPALAADADIKIDGEAGSYFGYSMISGDFNADGETDIAVGAIGYSTSTGRVYIFTNDGAYPALAADANNIITGESAGNQFGIAFASGDFNADGEIDLAVGANGYSTSAGRVYIFTNDGAYPALAADADIKIDGEASSSFGSSLVSGDFNADGKTDLVVGAQLYSSYAGRVYILYNNGSIPTTADEIITGEASSRFGSSLTSGDFNADGKVDLAVGAYRYSTSTGRVYIFYNDGSTPTTAATADVIITGEASSYFGYSVTSGDFNADGKVDLAVGAYYYSNSTGRAYIFYSQNGQVNLNKSIAGEGASDNFGMSLASGDFNADGRTDLAVSASNYPGTTTGRVYIFYNDGSISATAATADVIITGESTSYFGASLISGDFNADGKTDLAVGAIWHVLFEFKGRVYIFYNDGAYPVLAADADVKIDGENNGDYLGTSFASGDFNADGKTDLAIGARRYPSDSGAGRVYIFYNDGAYPALAADADVKIDGENAGDEFSTCMASGDFNADGETDLAVGANGYSTYTGRAYIFYNDGAYPALAADADVKITGEALVNHFGASLTSGDFNADGKTDLAVGAQGYSTSAGRIYIFYNDGAYPAAASSAEVRINGESLSQIGTKMVSGDFNADGRTDLAAYASYLSGGHRVYIFYNDGAYPAASAADLRIDSQTGGDFGWSLAAGDFNDDGKTDLAVGEVDDELVYIFETRKNYAWQLQARPDDPRMEGFYGEEIKIDGPSIAGPIFGCSMISGDFNFDGNTDLAVGAYGYEDNGAVFIFYNDGLYPNYALNADSIISISSSGSFGYSMTSGDFNFDGKTDLAIGARGYSSLTGRAYIFYQNTAGGFNASITSASVTITGEDSSRFSFSLTSGDFNADGKVDLAVGAYFCSSGTGRAYIFYNDGSYPTTAATADVKITGEAVSFFGYSMTSGDFNADGKIDLAVGAYYYSNSTGRAYIFYNGSIITKNASDADIIITGEAENNYFCVPMIAGDFNADGKIDLAVGAPGYSTNTGRAYIFYNGNIVTENASGADEIITGEALSYFGYSLASGDFNADGKTDLAIGAYYYPLANWIGRAYIFYNDGAYPALADDAEVKITGEETLSKLGTSLASGDFNADGKTDLAVGASGYNSDKGRVYIYTFNDSVVAGDAGSALGSSFASGDFNADGKIDLAVGAPGYSTNTGRAYIFYNGGNISTAVSSADVTITGETNGDYFGKSMISGDFNADGETDIAIGATGYSTSAGRVYIFTNDGAYPSLAADANNIITGESAGDQFGIAFTSGDFNADGEIDLAVGANGYSTSAGRAYIIYNDGAYPALAADADVKIDGEAGSAFGVSLSSGDFNNDGETDLAVGANTYSSNAGRVYIFNNDGAYPNAVDADTKIDGEATSYFGYALASGDFNTDGEIDLAVGAHRYSSYAGRVYILYNDGSIPTTAATADEIIDGESGSYFGFSLAPVDFNADGRMDLAAGAYAYSSSAGRIYVFYNDTHYTYTATEAEVKMAGASADNYFGYALGSGDFNADGKDDLAIGETNYNSGAGRFQIIISEVKKIIDAAAKFRGTINLRGTVKMR